MKGYIFVNFINKISKGNDFTPSPYICIALTEGKHKDISNVSKYFRFK